MILETRTLEIRCGFGDLLHLSMLLCEHGILAAYGVLMVPHPVDSSQKTTLHSTFKGGGIAERDLAPGNTGGP